MSDRKTEMTALLEQAAQEVRRLRLELAAVKQRQHEPIAIVSMACRFPGGANNPEAYWQLLEAGRDGIVELAQRWKATWPPAQPLPAGNEWAGLLDDIEGFDASFFSLSKREADKLDPIQRLLLEVTYEALESAGYPLPEMMGSRTGVFVGVGTHDYELNVQLDPPNWDAYALTGTLTSLTAGRLSYFYGLNGPSISLDTACASSLVALHLACHSLRRREVDVALAGGANVITSPLIMHLMGHINALSLDGRCKTFDARANGYVRSEGCGMVVLKRLSDAQNDGDNILAIVRGTAVNQDGRSAGMTAPNPVAQAALLREALKDAHVEAKDISYIEAHGTGTPLGDPIEIEALSAVLGAPQPDGAPLYVGSAKTNIGHAESAAGIAALLKVVLSLQHETIPKHLHLRNLNPRIRLQGTRLAIPTQNLPWKRSTTQRLAGISGFGFSGTNAHAIVEEGPVRAPSQGPAESLALLVLSGQSPEARLSAAQRMVQHLSTTQDTMADMSYTSLQRRTHHTHRIAVTGSTRAQWTEALQAFCNHERHACLSLGTVARASGTPRIAFIFPGHGPQWLGMGRSLLTEEPVFRQTVEACDAAMQKHAGFSVLSELLATPEASRLEEVDVVQLATFAVQVGLAATWKAWGVVPDAVLGHSFGEVMAAHVAGALELDAAVQVVATRSRLVRTVRGQGAMLAVDMELAALQKILEQYPGKLVIGAYNGGTSWVVSGDRGAIVDLESKLTAQRLFNKRVKIDYASHSHHMATLAPQMATELAGLRPAPAQIPFYSSVTGRLMETGHDAAYWSSNLREPVQFGKALQSLYAAGYRVFLECSAHPVLVAKAEVLLRAVGSSERADSVAVVASLRRDKPERATLLQGLGDLHVFGAPIAAQKQGTGRLVPLPSYPWQRERHWVQGGQGSIAPTLQAAAGATAAGDELLVQVAWDKIALPAPAAQNPAGAWIVVGGERSGFRSVLAKALADAGANVVQIPPGHNFQTRLKDVLTPLGACRGIVHLGALDASTAVLHGALRQSFAQGPDTAAQIVQTLVQLGWRDLPRLWCVTEGATRVGDEKGRVAVEQAPLWGVARTLPYEHAALRCGVVDVRFGNAPLAAESMATNLAAELLADGADDEIVLRPDGARYVARLWRRTPPVHTQPLGSLCHKDATYWISGAVSPVTLAWVQWLVDHNAGHVAWGVPQGDLTPTAQASLHALQKTTPNLTVYAVDLADKGAAQALFARLKGELPPLRGVLHASSLVDNIAVADPFAEQAPDFFSQQITPDALAAWHLHENTMHDALDFFVVNASVTSFLGGWGQGARAAVGAFLDAMAWQRRAQGVPCTVLNWGGFGGTGHGERDKVVARVEQLGMRAMSLRDSLNMLPRLLNFDAPVLGVFPLNGRQWLSHHPQLAGLPRLQPLLSSDATPFATGVAKQEALRKRLESAAADKRADIMEDFLRTEIADALQLKPSKLSRDVPFSDFGVDSFMTIVLRTRLEDALGLKLSAALLMVHPTLAVLTEFLLQGFTATLAPPPAPVAPPPPPPAQQTHGVADVPLGEDMLAFLERELMLGAKVGRP